MEVNSKNITRLINIWKWRLLRNKYLNIKKIIGMTYLLSSYFAITLFFAYRGHFDGLYFFILPITGIFLSMCFMIINKFFLTKLFSREIVWCFNILTILTVICLTVSLGLIQQYYAELYAAKYHIP